MLKKLLEILHTYFLIRCEIFGKFIPGKVLLTLTIASANNDYLKFVSCFYLQIYRYSGTPLIF